jgi:chromosome segregation ATPase
MNYDALCAGLRNMDLNPCREAADAIVQLQARVAELDDQVAVMTIERDMLWTDNKRALADLAAAREQLAVAKADRNTYDSAHKNEAAAHLRTLADLATAQARVAELEVERVRLVKSAREAWDERAKAQTFATNCQNRTERSEDDLAAARALLFKCGQMTKPPCFVCGYNGEGYYNPTKHPCAAHHHALAGKDAK